MSLSFFFAQGQMKRNLSCKYTHNIHPLELQNVKLILQSILG